jgi:DNA-binding transcriptional ArsR family regulator
LVHLFREAYHRNVVPLARALRMEQSAVKNHLDRLVEARLAHYGRGTQLFAGARVDPRCGAYADAVALRPTFRGTEVGHLLRETLSCNVLSADRPARARHIRSNVA